MYLKITLSVEKRPVESDQLFSVDQYFSLTSNFTQLQLTPTKNFYQFFFLLNKNQITKILRKLWHLLYHNPVERRWVGKGSKKMEKWVMLFLHMFAEKTSFTIKLSWKVSELFLPYLWHSWSLHFWTNYCHFLFYPLLHLVNWKLRCCLNFRGWNKRRLKK